MNEDMDTRNIDTHIDTHIVKKWWNTTNKSDFILCEIRKGNIEINGYQIFIPCGPRAFVAGKKDTKIVTLFDCGAPDTPDEFFNCLRKHLDQ